MYLTSVNNAKVKMWQKLLQKKYRDQEHLFLVEDEHLVTEALKKGVVKEIITTDDKLEFNVETYYVTENIMKILTNQVTIPKMMAVVSTLKEKPIEGNIIILDNIQDPGNLGTIIRSAVAFNFPNIILGNNCVDLYNPKVIRASEGMLFYLNYKRCDLIPFLKNLDSKYKKITTSVTNGKDIKNISFQNCAIVIGNEGLGVSKEVSDLCEEKVYIKMTNNCESLNAGVSASILMYEVYHG